MKIEKDGLITVRLRVVITHSQTFASKVGIISPAVPSAILKLFKECHQQNLTFSQAHQGSLSHLQVNENRGGGGAFLGWLLFHLELQKNTGWYLEV